MGREMDLRPRRPILIVEDEEAQRVLIGDALEPLVSEDRAELVFATAQTDALQEIRARGEGGSPFQMLITDMRLSEANPSGGLQVLRSAVQYGTTTPGGGPEADLLGADVLAKFTPFCIVVTNYADTANIGQSFEAGAATYIPRDMRPPVFRAILRHTVDWMLKELDNREFLNMTIKMLHEREENE